MNEREPKVLLVSSDIDAIPPLYRRLSEAGCRVATYSSASAACSFAEKEQPDLILTSVDFPGFKGLGLVRRLRSAAPESRIIVLGPAKPWLCVDDVVAAGADGLLAGIPSLDAVLELVHELLGGHFVRTAD